MSTKSVSLRLPEELYQYLTDRAEREHRTLSNLIVSVLLDAMEQRGEINER